MKRTLAFLLAASLFLITPAVASASRGGGHGGGQTVVTREKVVIYKTTQQGDHRYDRSDRHRYDRSDRRDYRYTRNYHRPSRHAPAFTYYTNHPAYRHGQKVVIKHHAPVPKKSVVIGVPSIVIRLGF